MNDLIPQKRSTLKGKVDPSGPFHSWFKLVRVHSPSAALSIAGMAIGFFLVVASSGLSDPEKSVLIYFGSFWMGGSSIGFFASITKLLLTK